MDPLNPDISTLQNVIITLSAGLLLFIVKECWQAIKGKNNDHDLALQRNTESINGLRLDLRVFGANFTNLQERHHDLSQRVAKLEEKV
jgi:hypothetical protein